ncbi:glycosyltransferase family 4 protein [Nitriliruptor alkaliphilus]|uniref:glycosyltransferase family 4 protein n=1 Tax=Nitriliruptor alkaliphilus TaxID=427918 RepID=UPI00069673A7|nr:glycosyltransferase family 4 protein [Nitriliruptor alkaliphilus]
MRVALVSPYALTVPGGVQAHVTALAAALRRDQHEVVVIGPGDARAGRTGELTVGVGRPFAVPFNGSVAPIALWPLAARSTRRAIAAVEPDVIHVHEPLVPWVGLAAATTSSAPVIGTFHAWSDSSRLYRTARPVARRIAEGLAVRLAVSEAAAGYHAGALGLPTSRFRLVPNGVDVARFADAEPFADLVDPARPALLFVGRLERRKGLEPLVRAFTRLKTDRPELRLIVVGDGPERERCEGLLPAGLRSDVRFLGRVDHDDLPRYYASCDLAIQPSLGGESFGIVLLEAMAAGKPLVASDIPGYRTVASDGRQGRLVAPNDPAALATAIGALLDNPALRTAMADDGRRTVAEYDWSRVAARVADVYREARAG